MKFDLKTILIIAVVALATWNIRGCFIPAKNDEVWKEKLSASEDRVKTLQLENSELKEDREALIVHSRHIDSLKNIQSSKIEIRYKNIPVIVNAMPDDEINAAIEKRFGNNQ